MASAELGRPESSGVQGFLRFNTETKSRLYRPAGLLTYEIGQLELHRSLAESHQSSNGHYHHLVTHIALEGRHPGTEVAFSPFLPLRGSGNSTLVEQLGLIDEEERFHATTHGLRGISGFVPSAGQLVAMDTMYSERHNGQDELIDPQLYFRTSTVTRKTRIGGFPMATLAVGREIMGEPLKFIEVSANDRDPRLVISRTLRPGQQRFPALHIGKLLNRLIY